MVFSLRKRKYGLSDLLKKSLKLKIDSEILVNFHCFFKFRGSKKNAFPL